MEIQVTIVPTIYPVLQIRIAARDCLASTSSLLTCAALVPTDLIQFALANSWKVRLGKSKRTRFEYLIALQERGKRLK